LDIHIIQTGKSLETYSFKLLTILASQVHDSGDDFSAECDEIHKVETSDEPQDVSHGGLEHVQADGRLNGKFLETNEILEKVFFPK
jgi:hypothetical protein